MRKSFLFSLIKGYKYYLLYVITEMPDIHSKDPIMKYLDVVSRKGVCQQEKNAFVKCVKYDRLCVVPSMCKIQKDSLVKCVTTENRNE